MPSPGPSTQVCKMALNLRSSGTETVVRLTRGGGRMIKALFTMILLSNDHAARLVERFQRLKA